MTLIGGGREGSHHAESHTGPGRVVTSLLGKNLMLVVMLSGAGPSVSEAAEDSVLWVLIASKRTCLAS